MHGERRGYKPATPHRYIHPSNNITPHTRVPSSLNLRHVDTVGLQPHQDRDDVVGAGSHHPVHLVARQVAAVHGGVRVRHSHQRGLQQIRVRLLHSNDQLHGRGRVGTVTAGPANLRHQTTEPQCQVRVVPTHINTHTHTRTAQQPSACGKSTTTHRLHSPRLLRNTLSRHGQGTRQAGDSDQRKNGGTHGGGLQIAA